MRDEALLEIRNLHTHFFLEEGVLKAVDGVSYHVDRRKILGIIGESGCGKSVTVQSVMQIVPVPGRIVAGKVTFRKNGGEVVELTGLSPHGKEIRRIRGRHIAMIFQEPMTSLSAVHTIGRQITEAILLHRTDSKAEAREIALEMLERVGISNPDQRIDEYPHQLSGGMRQRAMIAMALSCNPELLIADEPTTALDVTVQAQILELIQRLQEQYGMSVLYITHDLGVIAEIADDVVVMYLGKVVERAPLLELFRNPLHPYTRRLLKSIPRLGRKSGIPLEAIDGTVPIPMNTGAMCGFFERCREARAGLCDCKIPALVDYEAGHHVRCFLLSSQEEEPETEAGDIETVKEDEQ